MKPSWWETAEQESDEVVEVFTAKLRDKLNESPEKIIRRKNPFLFRVRVVSDVQALTSMVIDAYLSSSEETMFGNVLEDIAIIICKYAKNGRKSGISNIDLEYDESNTRTIMQIKSGVNWGNASQHRAQRAAFSAANRVLRQGNAQLHVRCVEGICYGRSQITDRGTHFRIVGRCFWEDISGWQGTTNAVMDLIGKHASNGLSGVREQARERMIDFLKNSDVVNNDDTVKWNKLLDLVMKERAAYKR